MAFTYDPTTPRGAVRLLCTDTDSANPIFQDAEIDAFLAMETPDGGTTYSQTQLNYLAAATALETIATSEALTFKVLKLVDFQTDGTKVAQQLMSRAATLREHVFNDDGAFDWAEQVPTVFSERERIIDQALRNAI